MEWIAEDAGRFVVRPGTRDVYDARGRLISEARRHVFAQFERGNAPDYAQKIGLKSFEFRTKPTYQGGGEFPSEKWLAYYDSEADQLARGWTDEERAAIEEHLPNCPGVIPVEKARLAPPWEAYEQTRRTQGRRTIELVADELAATVRTIGKDPGKVIAWERQEQKPGWETIVARMERLLAEEPVEAPDPEPLVAA